jgi:hypothetical protein
MSRYVLYTHSRVFNLIVGMTTNAWKKIAEDTWGQALNLANATKLPSILTGVAEVDLQKLVIRYVVVLLVTFYRMNIPFEEI